jgi:hypothetical protein
MVLTPFDTARAIGLIQDGRSQYYVARVLSVSRCSIQRAVKRFPETEGCTRRVGSDRTKSRIGISWNHMLWPLPHLLTPIERGG